MLLVLSYVIIMALYAGAFANYTGGLLPGFTRAVGQQALAPGIIVLLALVNLVGPQLIEQSEGFFNVSKLGILLVFIVAGLTSPALTLERLDPSSWVPPVEIVGSGMLVFLSYEGFELIANASDRIRWVSVLAAVACLEALGVMIVQLLGQPQHAHAVWLIVGVVVVPFVYECLYLTIVAHNQVGHEADSR